MTMLDQHITELNKGFKGICSWPHSKERVDVLHSLLSATARALGYEMVLEPPQEPKPESADGEAEVKHVD